MRQGCAGPGRAGGPQGPLFIGGQHSMCVTVVTVSSPGGGGFHSSGEGQDPQVPRVDPQPSTWVADADCL